MEEFAKEWYSKNSLGEKLILDLYNYLNIIIGHNKIEHDGESVINHVFVILNDKGDKISIFHPTDRDFVYETFIINEINHTTEHDQNFVFDTKHEVLTYVREVLYKAKKKAKKEAKQEEAKQAKKTKLFKNPIKHLYF